MTAKAMAMAKRNIQPVRPRIVFLSFAVLAGFCLSSASNAAAHFSYKTVVAKARKLASQSFQPPKTIPDILSNLTYDQYRDIRFRVENSLWRQSATHFQVMLVHPGLYYKHPVTINVVDAQGVHKVEYAPSLFSFGQNDFADKLPDDLGFAGLKVTFPLSGEGSQNQFLVFAGASYFRAIGRGENWGLSARGLAVDTGLKTGEEFPFFKTFWLVRPSPGAQTMTLYGLLDSKRVTGAYRFVVRPGDNTVMSVSATIFERARIKRLGVAPLTSMFFYGENSSRPSGYWRPEVHDSDGLLLRGGSDEWLWRPLINPADLRVSAFQLTNPRGFGLMQRDRHFYDYQDLESRYETRPSGWVTPNGDWGDGHVMLVEIPSDKEANDNIVAFWVPDDIPEIGKPMRFDYQIDWTSKSPEPADIGQTTATYIGQGDKPDNTRFVLDFDSPALSKLSRDAPVEGIISMGDGGKLIGSHITKNPVTGGWRLGFQIDPPDKPLELRVYLKAGDRTLSETWSYLLPPSR